MRDSEKKLFFSSPIGYSFLLAVMIILTFVMFAVLSLSASLRDYDYSKRAAEKNIAYYEANSKAYDIWQQIDEIFTMSNLIEKGLADISELSGITVLTEEEIVQEVGKCGIQNAVFFTVEINAHQKLEVLLGVADEESGKTCYKILKWKEVPSDSWESDTTLPVMGSE